MKKAVLSLCIILAIFITTSCSSEAEPYTNELAFYRLCYMDVVEMVPHSRVEDNAYLYYVCRLKNGGSVTMQISENDYKECFDPEIDELNTEYNAKAITFEAPVRINGQVMEPGSKAVAQGVDKKVFRFKNADINITLNNGAKKSVDVMYEKTIENGTRVYADIVEIVAKYGVSKNDPITPEDVICKCVTDTDEEIWLYMPRTTYIEIFDTSADLKMIDLQGENTVVPIKFSEPVRIYGFTAKLTDKFNNADEDEELPQMVIDFIKGNKEQVETAKIPAQPEETEG